MIYTVSKKIHYTLIIFISLIFLYGCNQNVAIIETQETKNTKDQSNIINTENKIDSIIISKTDVETQEDTIYTNKKEGFSIKIPSGRNVQENKYIGRVFLSSPLKQGDKVNENIIINTDIQSGHNTAKEYYQIQKQGIQNHIKNYKEVLNEDIKIAKSEGIKIIYKGELGNYKLEWQQIIFPKNGKFFLITYTATQDNFQNYIEQINDLIDSIKFEK